MNRHPTPDQEVVLGAKDRVRVVRAAPGSGKTWLIAEAVRREIATWGPAPGGVAALSFTNTARREIEEALGGGVPYPHIVRTIDAFLFRYVVRPLWKGAAAPRIFPPPPNKMSQYTSGSAGSRYSVEVEGLNVPVYLHRAHCARMVGGKVQIVVRPPGYGDAIPLGAEGSKAVLDRKKQMWNAEGLLTYSDASFIAAFALRQKPTARQLLARRFPLIVVDEVQDTGIFKSQALALLLGEEAVRGLIVGDPDQAIYEFTGATPEVFGEFEALEGARSFPLSETHRCSVAVASAASSLSTSGREIIPRRSHDQGGAFIIPHGGEPDEAVAWAQELLGDSPNLSIKVLSRGNAAIERFHGAPRTPEYRSPSLQLLDEAVRALRAGSAPKAIERASMALARVACGDPEGIAMAATQLKRSEVEWKRICAKALLAADRCADGIPFIEWGGKVKGEVHSLLEEESLPIENPIRAPPRSMGTGSWGRRGRSATSAVVKVPVQTVHGVKGETHDISILFVPQSTRRCPSKLWWGSEGEEKRIAYVAASRPKHWFILNVSAPTLKSLLSEQPEFVKRFTVLEKWDDLPRFTGSSE